MGESNGEWGDQPDDATRERRDIWHSFDPLNSVTSPVLDKFLASKGLDKSDLSRIGARFDGSSQALVFFYSEGLKYRSILDGRRWNEEGTEFTRPKLVRSQSLDKTAQGVIIAEGETDAAALSRHAPLWDIAVLPAGSKGVSQGVAATLSRYEHILIANDADEAGDLGAKALGEMLPHSQRLRPPVDGLDWCRWLADFDGDFDPLEYAAAPIKIWFTLREYLEADLGTVPERNWFEHGILPVRGQLVFHAAMKSLKSVLMSEMGRALATGTPLAGRYGYTRREAGHGAKVLSFQMEVPPGEYQSRMLAILKAAPEEQHESLLNNMMFYHLADNALPRLRAGKDFYSLVQSVAEDAEAEVLMFDPLQRMTGGSNTDKGYEMDPILDAFAELQSAGFTVVYAHHNNKAGRNVADPYSMTGTQRFGADADSICSLFTPKNSHFDNEDLGQKERNFTWTLRNGFARGASVRVSPDSEDPELMHIEFGDLVTNSADPDEEEMY